jgi:hypothetical protein
MKGVMLAFFLLISFGAMAEKDPCRKISRKVDRSKGTITYKSPETKYAWALKQIKEDTFFALLIHFTDNIEHFEQRGAEVEFDDGTTIVDEMVAVRCDQEKAIVAGSYASASSSVNGGNYVLQAFFRITPETAPVFAAKRIKRVRLHNRFKDIPPNDGYKLKKYITCLMAR